MIQSMMTLLSNYFFNPVSFIRIIYIMYEYNINIKYYSFKVRQPLTLLKGHRENI